MGSDTVLNLNPFRFKTPLVNAISAVNHLEYEIANDPSDHNY